MSPYAKFSPYRPSRLADNKEHIRRHTQRQIYITMVDSTKVLCPLFDEIEILILSD